MVDEVMRAIRNRFEQRCAQWVLELDAILAGAGSGTSSALNDLLHKLSGAAGSLGYDEIGQLAVKLYDTIANRDAVARDDLLLLHRMLSEIEGPAPAAQSPA